MARDTKYLHTRKKILLTLYDVFCCIQANQTVTKLIFYFIKYVILWITQWCSG